MSLLECTVNYEPKEKISMKIKQSVFWDNYSNYEIIVNLNAGSVHSVDLDKEKLVFKKSLCYFMIEYMNMCSYNESIGDT